MDPSLALSPIASRHLLCNIHSEAPPWAHCQNMPKHRNWRITSFFKKQKTNRELCEFLSWIQSGVKFSKVDDLKLYGTCCRFDLSRWSMTMSLFRSGRLGSTILGVAFGEFKKTQKRVSKTMSIHDTYEGPGPFLGQENRSRNFAAPGGATAAIVTPKRT